MHATSPRLRVIFHWIGVALTVPFFAAAALGFYAWLSGMLPAGVQVSVVLLVLAMLFIGAGASYGLCRAIAWIASAEREGDGR